jgi:hypothetical protein
MVLYLTICILVSFIGIYIIIKMPIFELNKIEDDSKIVLLSQILKNKNNGDKYLNYWKELYEERIKYLLDEKNISIWWWWIYKMISRK